MLVLGFALCPIRVPGSQTGFIKHHYRRDGTPAIPVRMLKEMEAEDDICLLALCVPSLRGGPSWICNFEGFVSFCEAAGLPKPNKPSAKTLLVSGSGVDIDRIAVFGTVTMVVREDEMVRKVCEALAVRLPLDSFMRRSFLEGFGVCGKEEWEAIWFSAAVVEARHPSTPNGAVIYEEWIPPLSLFWGRGKGGVMMRAGEGETIGRGWIEIVEAGFGSD